MLGLANHNEALSKVYWGFEPGLKIENVHVCIWVADLQCMNWGSRPRNHSRNVPVLLVR